MFGNITLLSLIGDLPSCCPEKLSLEIVRVKALALRLRTILASVTILLPASLALCSFTGIVEGCLRSGLAKLS